MVQQSLMNFREVFVFRSKLHMFALTNCTRATFVSVDVNEKESKNINRKSIIISLSPVFTQASSLK